MKVRTKDIVNILTKLVAAAGYDHTIPITGLVTLNFIEDNNILELSSTDTVHTMYGFVECLDFNKENFITSVDIQVLYKLLKSQTCEEIELEIIDKILYIKGNGNYKIPSIIDGKGEEVKIPEVRQNLKPSKYISKIYLKEAYDILKISAAPIDFPEPVYHNFWFDNNVISTDTEKASIYYQDIFTKKLILFNKTLNLLTLFDNDIINVAFGYNNFVEFSTNNLILVTSIGRKEDHIYFSKVEDIFNQSFDYEIDLNREQLLEIFSRFSIFNYGNVLFNFYEDNLEIRTIGEDFSEIIKLDQTLFAQFSINFEIINKYIKAITDKKFKLSFNKETKVIMIKDNISAHMFAVEV